MALQDDVRTVQRALERDGNHAQRAAFERVLGALMVLKAAYIAELPDPSTVELAYDGPEEGRDR